MELEDDSSCWPVDEKHLYFECSSSWKFECLSFGSCSNLSMSNGGRRHVFNVQLRFDYCSYKGNLAISLALIMNVLNMFLHRVATDS